MRFIAIALIFFKINGKGSSFSNFKTNSHDSLNFSVYDVNYSEYCLTVRALSAIVTYPMTTNRHKYQILIVFQCVILFKVTLK